VNSDSRDWLVYRSTGWGTFWDLVHSYGVGLDVFSDDIVHEATRGVGLDGSS
jgi:hypothetical protein